MKSIVNALQICLIVLCFLPATAKAAEGGVSGLFSDASTLSVVLTAPMGQLAAQKHQRERLYLPGQWAYRGSTGETVRLGVKVRTRGKFRLEICKYPPIRLNFVTRELKGTLFEGENKLKLVRPCKRGERYDEYVVLEYLAYRIYAALTDNSFLVRPLEISFVDSQGVQESRTTFGFIIEDEEQMARRISGTIIKENRVPSELLDPAAASLTELFQYFIGNGDYSVIRARPGDGCCHNVRVLDQGTGDSLIPVPYDFDSAGIVGARYAKPPPHLPIKSVRTRYFTGMCKAGDVEGEIWRKAADRFREQREEIGGLVADLPGLSDKTRAKTLAYVDAFFRTANNPAKFRSAIVNRCRS